MTNTEAIKILNKCRDRGFERTTYTIEEYHTARDMAIKALQEQNCDQCEVGNACLYCEHEFKAKADGEYISKSDMIDWLKDIRSKIKPQGFHTASEFEIAENQILNLIQMLQMGALPSVDIPPEHDGCKDCVYQDNPQDAMPCRECKHNYMDKWKARPSVEPYKGMTNGEVIKTIFDVDEIQVTENTVIVRVKGSFCAKMQFLLDWWNSPYEPQESEVADDK